MSISRPHLRSAGKQRRDEADEALQAAIANEASQAATADEALQAAIANEDEALQAATGQERRLLRPRVSNDLIPESRQCRHPSNHDVQDALHKPPKAFPYEGIPCGHQLDHRRSCTNMPNDQKEATQELFGEKELDSYIQLSKTMAPKILSIFVEQADTVLKNIVEDLRNVAPAKYFMAVSLLLKRGQLSYDELPESTKRVLQPVLTLLRHKNYDACPHFTSGCERLGCFEQWYVLCKQNGIYEGKTGTPHEEFEKFQEENDLNEASFKGHLKYILIKFNVETNERYQLMASLLLDRIRNELCIPDELIDATPTIQNESDVIMEDGCSSESGMEERGRTSISRTSRAMNKRRAAKPLNHGLVSGRAELTRLRIKKKNAEKIMKLQEQKINDLKGEVRDAKTEKEIAYHTLQEEITTNQQLAAQKDATAENQLKQINNLTEAIQKMKEERAMEGRGDVLSVENRGGHLLRNLLADGSPQEDDCQSQSCNNNTTEALERLDGELQLFAAETQQRNNMQFEAIEREKDELQASVHRLSGELDATVKKLRFEKKL